MFKGATQGIRRQEGQVLQDALDSKQKKTAGVQSREFVNVNEVS